MDGPSPAAAGRCRRHCRGRRDLGFTGGAGVRVISVCSIKSGAGGRSDSISFAMSAAIRRAYKFTAPRRALRMPPVDHGPSYQLRSHTGAGDESSRAFDACGMNGHGPFVSLDPNADSVSDLPVLHRKPLRA
jgi:hypothetical protein